MLQEPSKCKIILNSIIAVNKKATSKILHRFNTRGTERFASLNHRWVMFIYDAVKGCKDKHTYIKKKIVSMTGNYIFKINTHHSCFPMFNNGVFIAWLF